MSLKDVLKTATLTSIESLDLNRLSFYSHQNSGILSALYDKGVITDEDISTSLRQAVVNKAKEYYKIVTKRGIKPDHVSRPEILAYAIEEGIISMKDAGKIPFEERDAYEFCRHHRKENLLEKLKNELLNPIRPVSQPAQVSTSKPEQTQDLGHYSDDEHPHNYGGMD